MTIYFFLAKYAIILPRWTGKEFKKIDKDVLRITGESIDIEPQLLEKPEMEDRLL